MAHVAGTNGKGSTTALVAAMLQAGGLRVGRFTSPHVLSVEERITVDGRPIDPRRSAASGSAARHRKVRPSSKPRRRRAPLRRACRRRLRGRLGGRPTPPTSSRLRSRSDQRRHDHEAILGRGLRSVCRESSGIVKRGVRLVAALARPDLVRLARQTCAQRRAALTLLPPDAGRVLSVDLASGTRIELRAPFPVQLVTRFLGAHQVRNVALAAHAVVEMQHRGVLARPPDVVAGAARAFLPGRFQVLPPWQDDPTVVLDVGHNPEALEATLDVASAMPDRGRTVVVLGLMRDKKLGAAAPRLARFADEVVLTSPRVVRAWDPRRGATPGGAVRAAHRRRRVRRHSTRLRSGAGTGPGATSWARPSWLAAYGAARKRFQARVRSGRCAAPADPRVPTIR
jgi:dihydrofolate synthase/folylpolyglutamate synthase